MRTVFGTFLCGALVLSVGCGKSKPTEPVKSEPPAPVVQAPKDKKGTGTEVLNPPQKKPGERKPIPGALASDVLVKAYLDNPEETKKKHYEKQIVVEGEIVRATEDAPATNLALKGAKDKSGKDIVLLCSFPYDQREKVEKLKVGDKVAVQGTYGYFVADKDKLCVDMCRLLTD